jgi:ABC-type phosphate transport system substrate-binding protein
MQKRVKWITIAALLVVGNMPRLAFAIACNDPSLPPPIYVKGSSAVQPFISAMSVPLSTGTTPYTLVYVNSGSCTGVDAIVNSTLNTTDGVYFTANPTPGGPPVSNTCTMPTGGVAVDVGVSDVFGKFCTGASLPAGIKDFSGPAQAMCFVVPKASTQTALVGEEGYFVFGFPGNTGMAMPWLNDTFKIIRDMTSGTQGILASSIGVPTQKVHGTTATPNNSAGVLAGVTGSTMPDATIGLLAAAFYDAHRDTLTQLAFRAFKQYYAYYADSTPTSFDKRNVRDGHYLPFGYVHMLVHTDASGNPTGNSKKFVDWVLGNTGSTGTSAPFDITDIAVAAKVIPLCAMTVQRDAEGGDLSLYQDPAPCGCYFEFKATGNAPASCTQCTTTCATGTCRHGYCEAR